MKVAFSKVHQRTDCQDPPSYDGNTAQISQVRVTAMSLIPSLHFSEYPISPIAWDLRNMLYNLHVIKSYITSSVDTGS